MRPRPFEPFRPHLTGTAAVVAMMLVGLVWPDVDLAIPFVPHRSALTHSVIVPVALWIAGIVPPRLVAGALMGQAVSLTADLFPRAWMGFATIHVPLWGSLGLLSPLWLVANVLAALILAHVIVTDSGRQPWPKLAYGALALLSVAYAVVIEHSLRPLLAFPVLWWVSLKLATTAFPPEPRRPGS
jgi:MFS family permease